MNYKILKQRIELLFDSQGHIEPWGKDFWTENKLVEFGLITSPLWLPVLIIVFLWIIL